MEKMPEGISDFLIVQTHLILSSYRRWLGKDLLPPESSEDAMVKSLFFAPFVVASTNTEADPILNYGNQKALALWELDWNAFTRTPGRHTAEAMERAAREAFLNTVKKQGYISNYRGIRISSTGKRFEIQQATVWNLTGPSGEFAGQAVMFEKVLPQ